MVRTKSMRWEEGSRWKRIANVENDKLEKNASIDAHWEASGWEGSQEIQAVTWEAVEKAGKKQLETEAQQDADWEASLVEEEEDVEERSDAIGIDAGASTQRKLVWREKAKERSQLRNRAEPLAETLVEKAQHPRELMLSMRRWVLKSSAAADGDAHSGSGETASGGSRSQSQSAASVSEVAQEAEDPTSQDSVQAADEAAKFVRGIVEGVAAHISRSSTSKMAANAEDGAEAEEDAAGVQGTEAARRSEHSIGSAASTNVAEEAAEATTLGTAEKAEIEEAARGPESAVLVAAKVKEVRQEVGRPAEEDNGDCNPTEQSNSGSTSSESRKPPKEFVFNTKAVVFIPQSQATQRASLNVKAAAFMPTTDSSLTAAQRMRMQVEAAVAASPPRTSPTVSAQPRTPERVNADAGRRAKIEAASSSKAVEKVRRETSSKYDQGSNSLQATASAWPSKSSRSKENSRHIERPAISVRVSKEAAPQMKMHLETRLRHPKTGQRFSLSNAGRARLLGSDSSEEDFGNDGCMRGYSTEDEDSENNEKAAGTSTVSVALASRFQALSPGQLLRRMTGAGRIQFLLFFFLLVSLARRAAVSLARLRGRK